MNLAPKFGKLPPKPNPKTLMLSKYLTASLPEPPEKVYREYKIPASAWNVFGNDSIGDCAYAAIAHMVMNATVHTGTLFVPSEAEVITAYSAVSGYDPVTGANDNGAAITDVLNYWQTVGIGGHKILGWAAINPANLQEFRQAIWLFSALDLGVNLPQSAMDQTNAGKPWNIVTPDGGIVGGHSFPLFGYGSEGSTCVTWGQLQQMNWGWLLKYCDEAYCVITMDWFKQAQAASSDVSSDVNPVRARKHHHHHEQKGPVTPSGFDLATLEVDLKLIAA